MANESLYAAFERMWQHVSAKSDSSEDIAETYETKADATQKLEDAQKYTDTKVADLVNSAPETLDTLGELAAAMTENKEVIDVLNEALTNKADKSDIVQPDWNQNDETALDYVNNRTHWVEYGEQIFHVAAQTVKATEWAQLNTEAVLEEGKVYTVTINGNKYDCVCKYGANWQCFYLGNGNLVGETTDDTEIFAVESYDNGIMYLEVLVSGTYTISVSSIEEVVHRIPRKYIDAVGQAGTGLNAEKFNGSVNEASGDYSHAEGYGTIASNKYSHAEGYATTASGWSSHAEGSHAEASGDLSHAEGSNTKAIGKGSHVEGELTEASGKYSHAEGLFTKASSDYQHVEGTGNIVDTQGKYVHIVGNGSNSRRSNAHTLDWDGNAWFAGEVKVGGTGKDNTNAKTLTTKDYVDSKASDAADAALAEAKEYTNTELDKTAESLEASIAEVSESVATKADSSTVTSHTSNKSNPHGVTLTQLGVTATAEELNIMDGIAATTDELNYVNGVTSNIQTQLNAKAAASALIEHTDSKSNPHGVTADQVGADAKGTASSAVSSHNTNTSAHNDIRELITGLTNRMNALADSDDTTLDQLSEIVAYIKENKALIDSVTTSKVNVADIINNLTTNVSNKPLSAAQGVTLKGLIDALEAEFDSHTHKYAGSSSAGGSATSAVKLDSSAGSETQPVFFSDGKPVPTAYTLGKSVPSDAKFTDTVVQPDWNQNDETALDYVNNRTHWVEYGEQIFHVAAQTVKATEWAQLNTEAVLEEGKVYTVTINGNKYDCVCKYGANWQCFYLGNGNLVGETTDDTEIFAVESYDNGIMYLEVLVSGTYTISVSSIEEVVHRIPRKYIDAVGQAGTGLNAEKFNGSVNEASGDYSHAEGYGTIASNKYSHAEGYATTASGWSSHAEGSHAEASGDLSHAEGSNTKAIGKGSHVEGELTEASGKYSHAEGLFTKASSDYQHVEGTGNIVDTQGKYVHIVGNGSNSRRSNAHTLDWDGNAWFAGEVKVGGTGKDNTNAKTLATTDVATTSKDGLMSATDKSKLDGIASGANAYTHPSYTAKSSGLYKVTVDATGHVSATTAVAKADITGLGIPAQDTVYTHPTTSGNKHIPSGGSSGQILKWSADGTAVWANNTASITVDSSLSSTSTNPVQNKVINSALSGLANTYATKAELQAAIAGTIYVYSGVNEPTSDIGEDGDIYLVEA